MLPLSQIVDHPVWPNDVCFSGGRRMEASGRAVVRQTLGRGRDMSNRSTGRPSAASNG